MKKQGAESQIQEKNFGEFDNKTSIKEIEAMREAIVEEQDVELKVPKVSKIERKEITEKEDKNTTANYPYCNKEGKVLYEILRRTGRGEPFLVRYKNESGEYVYKLPKDVDLVPYNLPNVRQAIEEERAFWITEGESKADTLNRLGFTATTCAFSGTNKWYSFYNPYIKGAKTILILIDNDEASEEFAQLTTQTILEKFEDISVFPIRINEIYSSLKKGADIDDLIDKVGEDTVKVTFETIENTYA